MTTLSSRLSHQHGMVVIALMYTLLVGCSGGQPNTQEGVSLGADLQAQVDSLRDAGYNEQADIISDGEVTYDEYWDAYHLMADCVQKSGSLAELMDPSISPVDGLTILYNTSRAVDAPVDGESALKCITRYYETVDLVYFIGHEQTMDAPLLASVSSCLGKQGYQVTGVERSFRDLAGPYTQEPTSRETTTRQCIIDGVSGLYPNLIFIPIRG